MKTGSRLRALECRACCTQADSTRVTGTCPTCGHALFAVYDTSRLDGSSWWSGLSDRPTTLWRYRELLPVQESANITTLGEGGTPILDLGEVPNAPGLRVMAKDDGVIPTGSFKARGMAVAVSRARELGLRELFVPSAGNAGTALAAYSARAGLTARVYLPERTPEPMKRAVRSYGAEVVEVPGTIREAGETARIREKGRGSFDMSTLREPYRVEGKKTMGFEIVEQTGTEGLPDGRWNRSRRHGESVPRAPDPRPPRPNPPTLCRAARRLRSRRPGARRWGTEGDPVAQPEDDRSRPSRPSSVLVR